MFFVAFLECKIFLQKEIDSVRTIKKKKRKKMKKGFFFIFVS